MTYRNLMMVMTAALLSASCDDEILRPEREPVSRVDVTAPAQSLEVGASLQLGATPRDKGGTALAGRTLTWTSSDTTVASVSPSGLVSARSAGTAAIRATSEGKTGQAVLTVQPQPVAWVQITPAGGEIPIEYGSTRQLSAITRAVGGVELPGRPVTWSSSDTTVVAVSAEGLLQARGAGTVMVTAMSEGKTDQVRVRAYTLVERVHMAPRIISVTVGQNAQIIAEPRASSGLPVDRHVVWTSSDPSVATVDAAGRVTAVSPGHATITAASQTKTNDAHVTVGTRWNEQALLGVDTSALPAVLYATKRTIQGAERAVRFEVTEGSLLTLGSRYEIRLHGWLHIEGSPSVQALLSSQGVIMYHWSEGYRMFVRDSDGPNVPPQYREQIGADGKLSITGRPEPDAPEATLVFKAL